MDVSDPPAGLFLAKLRASLAAREVIVSTLAQIYAVSDADDGFHLIDALRNDIDPRNGRPVFDLPTALSLLVFFVFALQCTSTVVVMARETGGSTSCYWNRSFNPHRGFSAQRPDVT